jgi:uncharacterized protein (TIGR02246 family)
MVQQAVRNSIEETNARFTAALGRGDVAAVTEFYADDAVVLAPNAPMARGKEAIRTLFSGLTGQLGAPQLTLKTEQVNEAGDIAYEVGVYTLSAHPPGGGSLTDNGKYVVVWKRQGDASWKMAVDIWNTDSPPATS